MAISNNTTGVRPGVCTSTTRPTAPYEGQQIYETDTDLVRVWNGSVWRNIAATTPTNGSVLQTVYFDVAANATFAGTFVTTGITATITPFSASSKILITGATKNISHAAARDWAELRIYKNGASIYMIDGYIGDQSTTATAMSMGGIPFNYLDSPATTSSTVYAIFAKTALGNSWSVAGGSMVLMEIAA